MAVQLTTLQKLRDPGPKPPALLCVYNILKSQNTNQIEGSKENQTRKAQVSDLNVSYMKRILTQKISHLNGKSYSKTIRNFINVTDLLSQLNNYF